MNSLHLSSESSFLRFNPLTLLAQIAGQKNSGCLMVYSGSQAWKLYLEDGELVYASAAQQAFDRLEHHLRQMGRSIPTLVSAVRVQVRLLFEPRQATPSALSPDYQAVQWLLEQQYLTPSQAASLVESLARESITSLLSTTTGSYDLIDRSEFEDWFTICRLDLREIVRSCESERECRASSPRMELVEPQSSPVIPFAPSPAIALASPTVLPTAFLKAPAAEPLLGEVAPFGQAGGTTEAPAPARPAPRRYRVVCVDDSPSILKLIHSYLEEDDFSVFMINDPVRALMQVVRCKPDLVLLDVEMPNLDGYELCSLLRRHPAFKSVPILMVTGNTGFLDRARAKLVGSSGYLTKPFSRSELLKIVFRNLPVERDRHR
ncbi:MAG: response regulator [Synechococcales cyanobacterium RM1_1_8]|nr:response regulator [Synechococcales cyanobacterium RM1_1_8]